ncbi:Signal recognition particle receptor FtsY [Geodia barretti]|uniref:Signal recognition particle receptor FtsY n=2 Tax=Geodia barretti TaxID=519541 RepID=A0AA35RBK7_GEOBA|nr:Signal recognition particle receptor FtsY [Geodia barretti]
METARQFVDRHLAPELADIGRSGAPPENPKSRLQELLQGRGHPTPSYRLIGREGPDHSPVFSVEALVGEQILGIGEGGRKSEAEHAAAKEALENILSGSCSLAQESNCTVRRNRQEERQATEQAVKPSRDRWFGRIVGLLRSPRLDDAVWDEIEEILISSDVGVETSLRIIEQLRERVKAGQLDSPDAVTDALKQALTQDLSGDFEGLLPSDDGASKPYVILMVGVNGVGKTTSIGKLAHHFSESGKRVVIGAADTFRAAAAEQLEILGERVGVDVIRHAAGADPGAVAYDAYQASKARGADVLIIDTAGRLHTKSNLMEELRKIHRVLNRQDTSAPHEVILTLDATTGHNGLVQAKSFNEAVNCTGIFLAKLDGTARGGIVLAIRQELQVPILFIGTGEGMGDMAPFDAEDFVDALLAPV